MILEMLSYPFIARAFVVGILVSLCAALLGVSLVLKQYSMIGDGLSHVSYGALSIALACNIAPLKLSIPVVIVTAFLLLRMTERGIMKSDAAIAAVSASALAIGVSVTSLTTGMTTDVNSYMFGSILAMTREDVVLSVILSVVVLVLFGFCYHYIFAVTVWIGAIKEKFTAKSFCFSIFLLYERTYLGMNWYDSISTSIRLHSAFECPIFQIHVFQFE